MPELRVRRHYRQYRDDNGLTALDLRIITFISQGLGGQQIADKMGMSDTTVETYRGYIYKKLNARNSAHMVKICFEKGILKTPKV